MPNKFPKGQGKHAPYDKQAHKVGQSWGTEPKAPDRQPARHKKLPGHVQED